MIADTKRDPALTSSVKKTSSQTLITGLQKEPEKTFRCRLAKMKENLLAILSAIQTIKKEALEFDEQLKNRSQNYASTSANDLTVEKAKADK